MRPPGLKPNLISALYAALKRRSSTALPAVTSSSETRRGLVSGRHRASLDITNNLARAERQRPESGTTGLVVLHVVFLHTVVLHVVVLLHAVVLLHSIFLGGLL